MPIIWKAFWLRGWETLYDEGTVGLSLVPSSIDVGETVDANTETLGLTASGTDQAFFADSTTESLALAPTSSDTFQATDAASEIFVLVPSDTQAFAGTDSDTEALKLSPYVTEEYPVTPFKFTPSAAEIAQFIELGPQSETYDPSANGTFSVINSAGRVAQSFQIGLSARADLIQLKLWINGNPTDNLIVTLESDSSGSPSGTVLATGTISGSALTGIATYYSIDLQIDPSLSPGTPYWIVIKRSGPTDNANFYNINARNPGAYSNGQVKTSSDSGASYASFATWDLAFSVIFEASPLPYLILTPSVSDIAQFIDANTEPFILTPSGVEELLRGSEDAATETLSLLASGDDIAGFVDSATEVFQTVPQTSDIADFSDANTGTINTVPTATDIAEFIDAAAERLILEILPGDIFASTDAALQEIFLIPEAIDIAIFTDSAVVYIQETPSGVDIPEYADAATETLLFSPSGEDVSIGPGIDAATVYLKLRPSARELYKVYVLVSTAFRKWFSKVEDLKYSGNLFRKWWSSD